MASNTNKMSPVGAWVDELLNTVFFQPDDGVSTKAMNESFSPDLIVRINGNAMNFDEYKAAISQTRSKYNMSVQFNREVLSSGANATEGSVAQFSNFTLKDKQTGQEMTEATVALATVKTVNGKMVLAELTEVYRSAVGN